MIIRQTCARHGRTALRSSTTPYLAEQSCERDLRQRRQQQHRFYANKTAVGAGDRTLSNPTDPNREMPPRRIPGHLDETSSILDTSPHASTGRTRELEHRLNTMTAETQSLQAQVGAHTAAKLFSAGQDRTLIHLDVSTEEADGRGRPTAMARHQPEQKSVGGIPYANLYQYNQHRRTVHQQERKGTHLTETYDPKTLLHNPPTPSQVTLSMLLANQTHLGHATALWNPANSQYIFGVRDGIHIISLDTTYAYLQRASKVVQAVARNGGMILFVGTRDGQEEIVIRTASRARGYHIYDRWTPGTLTNGQQILGDCALKVVDVNDKELPEFKPALSGSAALRPDLVVVLNPIENEVCLHECGIYNVPTVGIVDTDANPSWVTYPIPANDDSRRSVALVAGVLGRAAEQGQRERLELAKKGKATYDTAGVRKQLLSWKKEFDAANEAGLAARTRQGRAPVVGVAGTIAGGAASSGGVGMMGGVIETGSEEIRA